MTDAVAAGRIAGGVLADPGFTVGLASGKVRSLANINAAIAKRFMISAWFGTRSWAAANPDAVRKFDAGVNEAATWAVKNPEAAAAVLRKYMRLTPTRAHERHARTLDPALLQPLFDAAVRYKVLAQPIDARTLIWTPP
jgi:ABC-type nitrate/sulfonate/bicarbonate transport system substrate-binding protein